MKNLIILISMLVGFAAPCAAMQRPAPLNQNAQFQQLADTIKKNPHAFALWFVKQKLANNKASSPKIPVVANASGAPIITIDMAPLQSGLNTMTTGIANLHRQAVDNAEKTNAALNEKLDKTNGIVKSLRKLLLQTGVCTASTCSALGGIYLFCRNPERQYAYGTLGALSALGFFAAYKIQ